MGDPKHLTIVSIDGTPLGCKAVRDRLIDLEIATPLPEMAKRAVAAAKAAAGGQTISPQAEFLPGIPYGPDDVANDGTQDLGLRGLTRLMMAGASCESGLAVTPARRRYLGRWDKRSAGDGQGGRTRRVSGASRRWRNCRCCRC